MSNDHASEEIAGHRREGPALHILEILDHLIYVIECIASELTGEAKFELGRLIKIVEASESKKKAAVLADLNESERLLRSGSYRYAATPLSRARRLLWKEFTF